MAKPYTSMPKNTGDILLALMGFGYNIETELKAPSNPVPGEATPLRHFRITSQEGQPLLVREDHLRTAAEAIAWTTYES